MIASVVAADLEAVGLAVSADLVGAVVFAAAGDDEINAWNFPIFFLESSNHKLTTKGNI